MFGTITNYESNRLIGFHVESRIHRFDVLYNLEDQGNSTRFTIEADIRWKLSMNIIYLFIRQKLENKVRKQLESKIEELKGFVLSKSY